MEVYLKQIKEKPISFSEDSLKKFTAGLNANDQILLQKLIPGNESKIIPFSSFNDDFRSWVNNSITNVKTWDVIVLYRIELNYYVFNVVNSQDIRLSESGEWVDTNTNQFEQYSNLISDPSVLRLGYKTYLKCTGMGKGTCESYPGYINLENKNMPNLYSIFNKSKLDETIKNLNDQLKTLYQEDNHNNYRSAIKKYIEFFDKLSTEILNLDYLNNSYDGTEDADASENDSNQTNLKKDGDESNPLNIILYGAPGTGKTYNTVNYALAIINHEKIQDIQKQNDSQNEENRKKIMEQFHANEFLDDKGNIKGYVAFTTFHQSYSYEDFVVGLKPNLDSNNQLKFYWKSGIFKKIADQAGSDPTHNYVIIIDEINRANISRVLGELITLLEADKRRGEINALSVILPSGEKFSVPKNLYVIGTMNTADKSISNIDVALRRRFTFIEQPVQPEMITKESWQHILNVINAQLNDYFKNTDLLIGQTYFMGKNKKLTDILNNAVIPLLYEYYEDNRNEVKKVIDLVISESKKDNIPIVEANDDYGRIKVEECQAQAKSEGTDNTVANKD